jgi:uncharacterized glyoxalase superfamily protein PhnB
MDCDDVVGLYAEVVDRGGEAMPPAQTTYGFLAFTVSDPDGYRLTFHQPS